MCIIRANSATIQCLNWSDGHISILKSPVQVATVTYRGPNNTNNRRSKHHQHVVSIGQVQRQIGCNNATVSSASAHWSRHRSRQYSKHNQRTATTGPGQRHFRPNNDNDPCTWHSQHAISIGHMHTLGPKIQTPQWQATSAYGIDRPSADSLWVHNNNDPCTNRNQHTNSIGHARRHIWPNGTHGRSNRT